MVMDQFVTTNRADYVWPYVFTIGVKPQRDDEEGPLPGAHKELCPCYCTDATFTGEDRKILAPPAVEEQSWSRLGPMGPLLDPKLYPARVGSAPEFDTSRYNQPNVFLKKLQEKYPFLYEVLKTASPADMLSRINRDRLRTTYQVDYCNMAEYPNAPYDELLRASGMKGAAPCEQPKKLPGDPCRALTKDTSYRRGGDSISKEQKPPGGRGQGSAFVTGKTGGGGIGGGGIGGGKSGGKSGGGGGGGSGGGVEQKCEGGIATVARTTEYRDVYNKLGNMIISNKIHYRHCKEE